MHLIDVQKGQIAINARSPFSFQIDGLDGPARSGVCHTAHGPFATPAFMPVGTQATIKGLTGTQLRSLGAQIILSNTYHLTLRPGDELIAAGGGLHRFMGWSGPILTDSGGFQVFSLAKIRSLTDSGAIFRSHIDGATLELTPEKAIAIQENLGSDIAMVLDECPPADATPTSLESAIRRTLLWAQRSRKAHKHPEQALFAIVQGGLSIEARTYCAHELVAMDFVGYALGGFSVGESPEAMHALLPRCAMVLPEHKPRYLMGVGRPQDLLAGIAAGIDMFDCVMPTRNGRNALAFTKSGPLRLRNACYRRDDRPIESNCSCECCGHYSRSYIHHLFNVDEMLGPILLSIHNLTFYLMLMREARSAIMEQHFAQFHKDCLAQWADSA